MPIRASCSVVASLLLIIPALCTTIDVSVSRIAVTQVQCAEFISISNSICEKFHGFSESCVITKAEHQRQCKDVNVKQQSIWEFLKASGYILNKERWLVNSISGMLIAAALVMLWQHKRMDVRTQLWVTGSEQEEQEDEMHARRRARMDVLRGMVIVVGPCGMLHHLSQSNWVSACVPLFLSVVFVLLNIRYQVFIKFIFLFAGVLFPVFLTASLVPEASFWSPTLSIPVILCIGCDSFAQHSALAMWGMAFVVFNISSPGKLAGAVIIHAAALVVRLWKMRDYKLSVSTAHNEHTRKGILASIPVAAGLLYAPASPWAKSPLIGAGPSAAAAAALALVMLWQHKRMDVRMQLWVTGSEQEEQEDEMHARRKARMDTLRGMIMVVGPCSMLHHLSQSNWVGACFPVFFWLIFVFIEMSWEVFLTFVFLFGAVMFPAYLTASLLLQLPETSLWSPCLVIPVLLWLGLDSFAQHSAVALWGMAFMMLCNNIPEITASSLVLHLFTLYLRVGSVHITHLLLVIRGSKLEEQRRAELQLEAQEKESLAAAAAARMRLIAAVAHDLKSPMAACGAGCKMIRRYSAKAAERLAPQVTVALDMMEAASLIGNITVNNMLVTSLLLSGRTIKPALRWCNIRTMLQNILMVLRPVVAEGVRIDHLFDPDVPEELETDEAWVTQILMNMITNAMRHTKVGTITIRGCMRVKPAMDDTLQKSRQNELVVSVEDTGCGLSEKLKQSLFKEAQEPSEHGSGIGLYTVGEKMAALGGSCGCEDVGTGSLFWFAIPSGIEDEARQQVSVGTSQMRIRAN